MVHKMIHEWRTYRLKTGAATEYLSLLYDHGLPFVTRHLPLTGYWLAESGPLNVIHHLWSYADWAEREASRTALAQEEQWTKGFLPKAFALVEEQENRFLRLTTSSPGFDTALKQRRSAHAVRDQGQPLYAAQCAAFTIGNDSGDSIATWDILSGKSYGSSLMLLPRSADPLSAAFGTDHVVLRPLAFSPL